MIKLLALDIDGTILKKDYTLSDSVKKAIQDASKAGIKVVLATGRMYSATTFITKELELDTPVLTYSGGLVRSRNKVFYEKLIPTELAYKVIKEIKNFDVQLNLYFNDELYSEKETPVLIKYCEDRKLDYNIKPFDEIEDIHANKLLAIGKTPEATTELLNHLQEKFSKDLVVVRSLPTFCEIIAKDASKGKAILFLAEKWGISPKEIMAVGDQDNDIELLKVAGTKVAMGNATEDLKAMADYIAPSVEDDGLAVAIEKFILGEKNV